MATRDIFAASRFLGHSSVKVTEQHYAGLIQSLQVEYTRMFEDTLWKQASGNLQLTCNFDGKPGQSRVIEKLEEAPFDPGFLDGNTGFLRGGTDPDFMSGRPSPDRGVGGRSNLAELPLID